MQIPTTGAPPSKPMRVLHMAARRRIVPAIDPRYANYLLRVGRSRIHRFGVYALKTIPPGRKVIEYTGERLNRRQALARQKRQGLRIVALFRLNRYWILDGAVGGSGAELINHSCDPNLSVRWIRGHILYFSRRRIRPGEELLVDYRFPAKSERVDCHCGSSECRGTINLK